MNIFMRLLKSYARLIYMITPCSFFLSFLFVSLIAIFFLLYLCRLTNVTMFYSVKPEQVSLVEKHDLKSVISNESSLTYMAKSISEPQYMASKPGHIVKHSSG